MVVMSQFCCEYNPLINTPRDGVQALDAVWWFPNLTPLFQSLYTFGMYFAKS